MPVGVGHFLKSPRKSCMHKKERVRAVQDRRKSQKLTPKKDFILLSKWRIKLRLKTCKVTQITKNNPNFIFTTPGPEQTITSQKNEFRIERVLLKHSVSSS